MFGLLVWLLLLLPQVLANGVNSLLRYRQIYKFYETKLENLGHSVKPTEKDRECCCCI